MKKSEHKKEILRSFWWNTAYFRAVFILTNRHGVDCGIFVCETKNAKREDRVFSDGFLYPNMYCKYENILNSSIRIRLCSSIVFHVKSMLKI